MPWADVFAKWRPFRNRHDSLSVSKQDRGGRAEKIKLRYALFTPIRPRPDCSRSLHSHEPTKGKRNNRTHRNAMHCSSFSIPLRSTISGNNRNKEHTKPLTSRLPQLPFFAAFPFSGSLPQSPEERQHKKERVASAAVFTSDMGHRSAYPQTLIQLTSRELPNYLYFLRSSLLLFSLATPPPPLSFFPCLFISSASYPRRSLLLLRRSICWKATFQREAANHAARCNVIHDLGREPTAFVILERDPWKGLFTLKQPPFCTFDPYPFLPPLCTPLSLFLARSLSLSLREDLSFSLSPFCFF